MRILFVWILITLAVVGVVLKKSQQGASGGAKSSRPKPKVPVEVALPTRDEIREVVILTGSLESESIFTVASKVGGRLETLHFEAGDSISRGELVAELEDEEYVQAVAEVEAEVAVAKARVDASKILRGYAQRELERVQALATKKLVADTELDAKRGAVDQVRADGTVQRYLLAQKEAALEAARVRLAYTQVRALWEDAPEKRVVAQRFAEEGALLSPGAPLVSVMTLDPLRAEVFVIERDYARVNPGQTAVVSTDAYPGETFPGTVLRVAPRLESSSRQARVEVRVENPEKRLRPGMFARVELELEERSGALVLPRPALVRRGGVDGVFVVSEDRKSAEFVPVELGIVNEDRFEVRAPKIEREVLTLGHHLLSKQGEIQIVSSKEDA